MIKFNPITDNSGVLTDEHDNMLIAHHENDKIILNPVKPGQRPTMMNREAFDSLVESGFTMRDPTQVHKPTSDFVIPPNLTLSPEYQLYLAKELIKDKNVRKGHDEPVLPRDTQDEPKEITGYEI